MATFTVDPATETVQAKIQTAGGTANPPHTILLLDGIHTTAAGGNWIFDSGFAGANIAGLTIKSQNPKGATVVMTGFTGGGGFFYGGDSTNVTIKDLILTGTPPNADVLRDLVNSAYTGWTFDDIIVDSMTKTFFELNAGNTSSFIGRGITIKNIVSRSGYAAPYLINISGPSSATNLDLMIENIDFRVHGGTPTDCIQLQNVQDARIRKVKIDTVANHGITLLSSDATTYNQDIYVSNVEINAPANVGIHAGNTTDGAYTSGYFSKRVKLHNIKVTNSGGYGIEFENGAMDCELIGFYVYNTAIYGIPLAEDTERITVSNGLIDTVTNANGAGVITSVGHFHRITDNTIQNCPYAFNLQYQGAPFVIPEERNMIRGNTVYKCGYMYRTTATAMPETGMPNPPGLSNPTFRAHMLGPNVVYTPTTAYALVDDVAKTQAQFEALFPSSIDISDTVVSTGFPGTNLTPTQCLNLLAGVSGRTPSQALSLLSNTTNLTPTQALNVIVARGGF